MRMLIVVDYQQDFVMPDGALAVKDALDCLVPITNLLKSGKFDFVIATKDMHPVNHCSFKGNGGMWNPHCVAGTEGADFAFSKEHEGHIDLIWHKGRNPSVEEYSPYNENTETFSELIYTADEIYVCGVALDYCVKETALDCANFCDEVYIVEDAVKAVNTDKHLLEAELGELYQQNIKFVRSVDLLKG